MRKGIAWRITTMAVTWNWKKNVPSFLGSCCVLLAILGSVLLIGITISANEASAWTLTADFESGTVGQKAQGTSGFHGAGNRTTFSNEKAHSGSKSAKFEWFQGESGFTCCTGAFNFPNHVKEGQEIWTRGYFYLKSPWSWGQFDQTQANVIKVIRFHQLKSDGTHLGYLSAMEQPNAEPWVGNEGGTLRNGVSASGNMYQNMVSPAVKLAVDRWHSLELYSKFHNTQGIARVWVDGVLVLEYKGLNTARDAGNYYDLVFWMSYWNGGAPQGQVLYIDDIVVTTNTPADRDAAGNPMIGLQPQQTDTTAPQPPKSLRIN